MTKTLILVRGIPGAGKSTFAERMNSFVISADDYFTVNGKYFFDASLLGYAHKWCQNETEKYMLRGEEKIFVANTFTIEKEMKPYYDMAKKYNYEVFSIIVENRHNGKTVHNVPEQTVEKMKERFNIKL